MSGAAERGRIRRILEFHPDAGAVRARTQALFAIDRDDAPLVSHENESIKREVLT